MIWMPAGVGPGVRRAGLPKAKPSADAGPAAPQGAALIIDTAKFGNAKGLEMNDTLNRACWSG